MPRWLNSCCLLLLAVAAVSCGEDIAVVPNSDPEAYKPGTVETLAAPLPAAGGVDITAVIAESFASTIQVLWQVDDGTETNRYTVYLDATRALHFAVTSGGLSQSDRTLGIINRNGTLSAAFRWNGNSVQYRLGGLQFTEYGVVVPAGLTTERFGTDTQGNRWAGSIALVSKYDTAQFVIPLFGDSFNRLNTAPGTLGFAPDGNPYTLSGAYVSSFPLPPAVQGQITARTFIATPPSVVYASKNLGTPIRHVSAVLTWDRSVKRSVSATAALIISPNANLIDNLIHITLRSSQLLVQKRLGGPFITLATLNYNILDGAPHTISVDIAGSTVTARVDGASVSATDPDIPALVGPYVAWEHYSASQDVYPLKYLSVAASP